MGFCGLRKVENKFGGDHGSQLPFVLEFAKRARKLKPDLKFCFKTNGIIKFDLKFFEEKLSLAIVEFQTKELLKISKIAKFLASLDKEIPYCLLTFYPCFKFLDLPTTSWEQAKACFDVAKKSGLKKVRIGNIHLLK